MVMNMMKGLFSSMTDVIWRISGYRASGFHALYLEDGNYWASGYNEREYRFDPKTGELLGWTYP